MDSPILPGAGHTGCPKGVTLIAENDRTTIVDVRKALERLDRKPAERGGETASQSAGAHGNGYDISSESLRRLEDMLTKIAGLQIRLYAVVYSGTGAPEFAVRVEGCFGGPMKGTDRPGRCGSPQCRLWMNIIKRVIRGALGWEALVRITACGVKASRDFFAADDVGPSGNAWIPGPPSSREDARNEMRGRGTSIGVQFEERSPDSPLSALFDTYVRALPSPP